jgi:alpha-glucoside transport system substrate-binding protein
MAGLLVAACGSDSKTSPTTTAATGSTTAPGATTAPAGGDSILNGDIKCTQQYKGKEVHIFSPTRNSTNNQAATDFQNAFDPLVKCTGVKVVWDGTDQFETEVKVRVESGNPPDIMDFPQPGGFAGMLAKGKLFPFPDLLANHVKNDSVPGWPELATSGGKIYGVPSRANVKSFIWYSPKMFADGKYKIPTTLEELTTLSDQIVKDGGVPWCSGIESGAATGWPVTDWFEDYMMRLNGPDVYDQWVQHKIPFNDPLVKKVADAVGAILKNPAYLGGANMVKASATTKFQDGGLPILEGKCYMFKQASFYAGNWPKGTTLGPDGQIDFMYFPSPAGAPRYMLGGGNLMGAGTDKPETYDTLLYAESLDFAYNIMAKAPGDAQLSPRKDFDSSKITDPISARFADELKKAEVFKFDGADMMPAAVGSGAFWKDATAWIVGGETTDEMLNNIEAAWKALPTG